VSGFHLWSSRYWYSFEHFRLKAGALLRFCALVALWVIPSHTLAGQPAIVAQAFYEDPTNQLDFDTIRQKIFTPYAGILNKGYSNATFWIRLDLAPQQETALKTRFFEAQFVLRLSPSFLDEIEFYDPQDIQHKRRITGTRHSAAGDEYKSANFNFVVKDLDQPRTVWLRLKTNSTNMILVELMTIPELTKADHQQNLLYGAYFGIILITFLLALLIIRIRFDFVTAVFAVKQLATIFWALFDRGYYRLFFDALPGPMPIADFRNFTSFFVIITSVYFDYVFLREFKSHKFGQMMQRLLMGIFWITLILYSLGEYRLGIRINMVAITVSILTAWFIALSLPASRNQDGERTGDVPKYVVVLCYSLVCVLLLPAVLPYLGIAPAATLSLNSLVYHGLLSSVAMAAVLGFRSRSLVVRQIELQGQLELSQRLAQEERENRIEQSKFMAMLSHELKTPLAGIKMVLATQNLDQKPHDQIVGAVEDIDAIVERCLHAEKIEEHIVNIRIDDVFVDEILKKIARRHSQSSRIDIVTESGLVAKTDQQILSVIFSNLIDNGCKYSPAQTRVEINMQKKRDDGQNLIEISFENRPAYDDWPEADKLFSKYYRSQNAHRVTGSGLGLYLVDQFTRMLGGTVSYAPTAEKIRFVVLLPVSS
jgi:signal transduction histidine kinase